MREPAGREAVSHTSFCFGREAGHRFSAAPIIMSAQQAAVEGAAPDQITEFQ